MANIERGMLFENEFSNIFVKYVTDNTVSFIEGFSPAAIHDMQEIPKENFIKHINEWGFVQNGYWD